MRKPLIWMLDDERELTILVQRMLESQAAYQVQVFNLPSEMFHTLEQGGQPDLLLLDIMMPEMDGHTVLERLRTGYSLTHLPIIMLTAKSQHEDIVRGLRGLANDYMVKPFHTAELSARIDNLLRVGEVQSTLDELKEMDVLKDHHILTASHELKGLIATIALGLSVLQDEGAQSQERYEHYNLILESMKAAVDIMGPLVNRYLDMQAVRSGSIELYKVAVSINDLVQEVVRQYEVQWRDKGMTVRTDLDLTISPIIADELRVMQVTGNLVSNAIKYSPHNSTIVLRTSVHGDQIRVEVEDKGMGIAEEDRGKLFREFARLQGPQREVRGTGVGLALSRELIRLHGGELGVTSTLGEGSTFWFEMPLQQAA